MLREWGEKRPSASSKNQRVEVDPTELAKLLGNLVFASACVPHGRTYMQNMLASFKGLVVDWRRGNVKPSNGSWGRMFVENGCFEDVEWWLDHLERFNCVPMKKKELGVAILSGTDASDYGAGELIYLDGAREEVKLVFTAAEKKRPINWRELLGILRVVQVWGPRLKGKTLLVETDNMAAKETAENFHSTARDMQDLLRRLLEVCAEHGITLRVTHMPGAKLHRPDQVSRGDPIEESRMRLNARAYGALERRWGPFGSYVGAERQHEQREMFSKIGPVGSKEKGKLFLHPSFNTVGTALRLIGERMLTEPPGSVRGIIIIPDARKAMWYKMVKYFSIISRIREGAVGEGAHLETCVLGRWQPVVAKRDSLVLAFPRSSGLGLKKLHVEVQEEVGDEYCLIASEERHVLPTSRGAFVWAPPTQEGDYGTLYMLSQDYHPVDGEEDGLDPFGVYLKLWKANWKKRREYEPKIVLAIDDIA